MIQSLVIVCDNSPIGKNSAIESIRVGAGFVAVGYTLECRILFMDDAIYLLSKNASPEAVNMDSFSSTLKLARLADLELYVLEDSLKAAGMDHSDLIPNELLKIVSMDVVAKLLLDADATFRL